MITSDIDITDSIEKLQEEALAAKTAAPKRSLNLPLIEGNLKCRFTEEQKDFICDMDNDIQSDSNPGTGKTKAAIAKLLLMELDGVANMENVYTMSFTKAATLELKYRHLDALKAMGMSRKQRVHFQTMHSICLKIIKDNYELLGISEFRGTSKMAYSQIVDFLVNLGQELDLSINAGNVRKLKAAIDDLNSSLIFDPAHIVTKKSFIETGMSIEEFTRARMELYNLNRAVGTIQLSDLLLYTLELLLLHPEVQEKERSKREVVICDEFQDLSLLQLKLLDAISQKLIVIGDISQQIYAFNGACPQIVEEYRKLRPGYALRSLTQSFRCGEEVAEFAKRIVRPNGEAAEDFKGVKKDGCSVVVSNEITLEDICSKIREELDENNSRFVNSYMFLYRNNFSILPIYELLYELKIPAQSDRFTKAYKIDIVSDIIDIIRVAEDPKDVSRFGIFKKLLKEFATYKDLNKLPLVEIVKQTGLSVLEIAYQFKSEYAGSQLMTMIMDVREMLTQKKPLKDIFNRVWPVYDAIYYKSNAFKYEQDADFYIGLIKPLLKEKTFEEFMQMEDDKERYVNEWNDRRMGVRCYTMHSSKGTEADYVYILDADDGIIPNEKKLDRAVKLNCILDAAENVRNERSLAFVAVTRAKKAAYILYNDQVAPIMQGLNPYETLDRAYKICNKEYEDIEYFTKFVKACNYEDNEG